ncbi:hypothetical protein PHISCL_01717 [Aspergillus sclerotialis]|uniref:Uncharacterized protein n=1 Tax=Aspergillus sclerotialis TaxID=2070753 RepID=A0A3A2ZS30_9EURO|nr:hypothetical protein PHISCL_01717 [Aspergillus sclerotialis]
MPKAGVKQKATHRVKSSRSPFEKTDLSNRLQENEDVDMDRPSQDEEEVPEKDEAEKKLEKLLFGDDQGFHDALRDHQDREMMALSEENEEEDRDLGDVADADLFFLDSGTAQASTDIDQRPATPSDDEDEKSDAPPAAWHDSDDERLTISLASHQRLRKLRLTESEDVVTGKEYVRRLRRQFQRLHPVPDWADPNKQRKNTGDGDSDSNLDDMDTDNEDNQMSTQPLAKLLQGSADLTRIEDNTRADGKRKLRQEVLDIQRLKDVGGNQPSSIDSLSFHPYYPVLLSSGPASTLFLHHVSPDAPAPNPLLTSLHIRRTPIHTSSFAPPNGNKIFASGRRRYFHIWDLDTGKVDKVNGSRDRKEEQKTMERFKLSPCGRYVGLVGSSRKGGGLVNILDSGTAQWIAQVRVDGRGGVADFAWWSDGDGMTVASKNGEISEWDGRLSKVVARWVDEGAVGTTVISLGGQSGRSQFGGDRWVAVGSSSGIVNVYDRQEWAASYAVQSTAKDRAESAIPRNPKPVRALDQLTTPISHLVFSPDGQLLVMASRWKRDTLRLSKCASFTFRSGVKRESLANQCNNSSSPSILHRVPQLAHVEYTTRKNLIRGHFTKFGSFGCS